MPHLIAMTDLGPDGLAHILDRADALRERWRGSAMPQALAGRRVALWFYGQGFRNRLAFEIGARAMGADVSYVPGELGIHEPLEDVGHYLANWYDMLVVRAPRHADLASLATQVDVPIINARTDYNHPCEILGDLQYIRRERGSLDGLRVAFVGEVTNLCRSWFEAAALLPISVTQIAPEGYTLPDPELARLSAAARGEIQVSHDMAAISAATDVVYTDCWPKSGDPAIPAAFWPYQIDAGVVARMSQRGFFLPCPPVTRGQEVSADAMQAPQCKSYAAKEFLLHAQNAVMELLSQ